MYIIYNIFIYVSLKKLYIPTIPGGDAFPPRHLKDMNARLNRERQY